ncbi:hypothetical protein [Pontibaca salina]|uniref:Uncharacterized protein n=1 Tax=Pontibaca salina TaxID=2795731 RepID=A0A934HSL7_9RHOB|nr:hypothetical protein [Pontibaca salina]MBI6629468.1 hypothetical protein [Pontibaca salina]
MTMTGKNTGADLKSGSYFFLLAALMLILATIGILHFFSAEDQKHLLAEGGFFENLTVLGYGVCLLLIWSCWPWQKVRERWYFSALIILFALRELDYDKSHFTLGLLKARQYTGDMVGFPEKIISIMLLVLLVALLISILVNETRAFISGLIAAKPSELAVLSSLVLIVVTKSVDGLGRKLADFNITISKSVEQTATVVEEIGELGIPIMFAVAIILSADFYFRKRSVL